MTGNPCQQKESRTCRCRIEQRHLHFRPRLRENLLRLRQGEQGGGIGAYPCQDAPQKLVAQIYGGTHGQECQRLGERILSPPKAAAKEQRAVLRGRERGREEKATQPLVISRLLESRAALARGGTPRRARALQNRVSAPLARSAARTALKKTSVPPTRSMEAIPSPMAPARTVRGWDRMRKRQDMSFARPQKEEADRRRGILACKERDSGPGRPQQGGCHSTAQEHGAWEVAQGEQVFRLGLVEEVPAEQVVGQFGPHGIAGHHSQKDAGGRFSGQPQKSHQGGEQLPEPGEIAAGHEQG